MNANASLNQIIENVKDKPHPKEAAKIVPEWVNVLGFGSSRLVIQDPNDKNSVLKIGIGKGIEQNKTEINIYNKATQKGVEHTVLPILEKSPNGRWIKTPFVAKTWNGEEKFVGPNVKELVKKLEDHGIYLYEAESGTYQGSEVLIDYGILN